LIVRRSEPLTNSILDLAEQDFVGDTSLYFVDFCMPTIDCLISTYYRNQTI